MCNLNLKTASVTVILLVPVLNVHLELHTVVAVKGLTHYSLMLTTNWGLSHVSSFYISLGTWA